MENKITKNLIVIFAIVFSLIFVAKANAAYNPYDSSYWLSPVSGNGARYIEEDDNLYGWDLSYPNNSYYSSSNGSNYNSNSRPGTTVVNNYYYQNTPGTASKTTTNTNTKTTTNQNVSTNSNSKNSTSDKSNTNTNEEIAYGNGLGASAYNSVGSRIPALTYRGSGGFMPSSIWQWILVVILILIIIILARILFRKKTVVHDAHQAHVH